MMIDILQQFLKRVTYIYLLLCFNLILHFSYLKLDKCYRIKKILVKIFRHICLDQQFDQISHFSQLKHFRNFSDMTQWIEKDFKNACRQLILLIIPLLSRKSPNAIHSIYTIFDFVYMVI